jgi:hypothetical protein
VAAVRFRRSISSIIRATKELPKIRKFGSPAAIEMKMEASVVYHLDCHSHG